MTTRILHLSDLHFGDDHYFRQSAHDSDSFDLADAISETLARAKISTLDAVLITGDLFSKNQTKDLVRAKKGLRKLIAHFTRFAITPEKVFFVPGNRDCSWEEEFHDEPFQFYDDLLESISPAPIKRNELPRVVSVTGSGSPDLDLILLDSCRLGTTPATKDWARVGDKQLGEVRTALDLRNPGAAVRIAVLHHHLLPVWGINQIWNPESPEGKPINSVSFTVDALNVLKELASCGVRVVLHGHQHKPFIVRHESYLGRPYAIVVIGAGSAGAKPEGSVATRRQFFVHEIEPDSIRCHSFMESQDHASMFELHKETSGVVALVDPIQDGHRCLVDLRASQYRQSSRPFKEEDPRDRSDLFYLLLSVVDCDRSRDLIREIEKSWQKNVAVTGIYFLMGKWDLLIQYRSLRKTEAEEFEQRLLEGLHAANQLELKGKDQDTSKDARYFLEHFTEREPMNVIDEIPSRGLAGAPPETPGRHWRTYLGNTVQYENQRCHRAFIYIPCGEMARRRNVFDKLRRDLREFEGENGIIESYAISGKEIMLEIFLTCSQMVLLNKLNRTLGKCLAGDHVQKYTLLCYGYDDRSATETIGQNPDIGPEDGRRLFPIFMEKPPGPSGAPVSS